MSGVMNMLLGARTAIAAAVDEFFNRVTLLLPGDGTNGAQNNTFLDSSTNNFTITRNGNTTQGTFSPFSQTGWSNYFDGSGDYIAFTSIAGYGVGTGNFSVQAFVNFNSISGNQRIFCLGVSGTDGINIQYSGGSTQLIVDIANAGVIAYTWTPVVGTWYQIDVVRAGTGSNQTTLYINGSSVATGTSSGSVGQNPVNVGGISWNSSFTVNGYISNLRFSNTARSISAVTTNYSSDANTLLLTSQSNRFVDNSSTGNTFTIGGTPSVQAFSPFAPTAAYSAATVGGSGYFDETSDYLSASTNTAFNCGTGNWTIEAWVYITAETRTYPIIMGNNNGTYSAGALAFGNSNNDSASYNNKFIVTGFDSTLRFVDATTHPKNTWIHIAVVRDSTTSLKMFRDGVQVASTTIASGYTFDWGKGGLLVGGGNWDGVNSSFGGNIFNLRFIKGTAVYSGAFTPPTAPLSTSGSASASAYPSTTNVNTTFAASECSLLLNFTNAGITDATAKNDLETVGNAQISTTQSKFGGSSMYFAGTSNDFVRVPPSRFFNQLYSTTQSFTIEFWIYLTAYGNPSTPFCTGITNGATGYRVDISNTGTVTWISNGAGTAATSSVSLNTWTYFAFVWDGSKIYLYKNGTLANTGGTTTSWTNNSDQLNIGKAGISSFEYPITGYIDDFRITTGVARSITTSPTTAFPLQ